ncbi:MAG: sulfurtransferase [Alphaproteobacteria bacterium]|nr:sulfurtransferase [Alphaproteobacteria bacterium]
MNVPAQISVEQFKAMMDQGRDFVLLDVREAHELDICRFDAFVHIPLGEIDTRAAELPADRHIVVTCHHGGRSGKACQILGKKGYAVTNLAGGIHEWAIKIDPSMETY